MPCGRDTCLGQGGTKDLTKHEQTNLHMKSQHSGMRPFHSHLGPIRKELVIMAETIFLGEHLCCTDSKDFKSGRTKATAILKVISQEIHKQWLQSMYDSVFFSLQTDETTHITVTQHEISHNVQVFDNTLGKVRCVFHAQKSVEGMSPI
jgi:hypothetical protein